MLNQRIKLAVFAPLVLLGVYWAGESESHQVSLTQTRIGRDFTLAFIGERDSLRFSILRGELTRDAESFQYDKVGDTRSGSLIDCFFSEKGEQWLSRKLERLKVLRELGIGLDSVESEDCCLIGEELRFASSNGRYVLEPSESLVAGGLESKAVSLGFDLDFIDILNDVLEKEDEVQLDLEDLLGVVPKVFGICEMPGEPIQECPMPCSRQLWEVIEWRSSGLRLERKVVGNDDALILTVDLRGEGTFERTGEEKPFQMELGHIVLGTVKEEINLVLEGDAIFVWNLEHQRLLTLTISCVGMLESIIAGSNDRVQTTKEQVWRGEVSLCVSSNLENADK